MSRAPLPLLLIRLVHPLDDNCQWYASPVHYGTGKMSALLDLFSQYRCVVSLSHLWVTPMAVKLPVKSRYKAEKIIGYALEDQLSEPVEQYFFHLATFEKGSAQVWVCKKALLQKLRTQLHECGLENAHLAIESSLLPHDENALVIVEEDDGFVLKTTQIPQLSLPKVMLTTFLAQLNDPSVHYMIRIGGNSAIESILPQRHLSDSLLAVLYQGLSKKPLYLDRQSSGSSVNLGQSWFIKSTVIMGLIYLLMLLINPFIRQYRAEQRQQMIQTEMVTILKSIDPNITRIVNPKVQFEQYIQQQPHSENDTFQRLMQALGNAHQTLNRSLKLSQLNFENNQLTYQIQTANLREIEQLEKAYQQFNTVNATFKVSQKDQLTLAQVILRLH